MHNVSEGRTDKSQKDTRKFWEKDIFQTAPQRSYNMSMIRSKDTKPEIMGRKFLFGNGFNKLHD
ncbi:MAG: hypothetical protein E3K36_00495 [Candidatus Brocadia sp.]|nr:hypothetical protein [Candidatus Brocadia sp.]